MNFEKKQWLMILGAWFLLSFVVLWFLGGACTSLFVAPSEVNQVCFAKDALSGLRSVPIIGLIIPYNEFVSLLYWFAPIAGFIFAFYAINWWNNYFESKEATSIIFPILLIVILLFGFFINVSWYYGESATLNSRNGVQVSLYPCFDQDVSVCQTVVQKLNQEYASQNKGSTITQFMVVDYWSELRQSIFLTFILGAIAAWVPLFAKNYLENKK